VIIFLNADKSKNYQQKTSIKNKRVD